MTDLERERYYRACRTPQPLGSTFGDHRYDDDEGEHDADLTDDDPDDSWPPS
jgi:hypothetical protein